MILAMKITAIRTDRLRLPLDPPFRAAWDPEPRRHFDATVVRVETDDDIVGIGSGDTMDGFGGYEQLFVGTDPLAINRQVRTIETISFHGGRFWPLEAALWDITGKVAGLPVATLFGGAVTRLPAYMSTGELKSPQERVEATLRAREQGFGAVKIRVAADRGGAGVETVARVRDAVGDDFTILVDLNRSWRMPGDVSPAPDVKSVGRLVAALEEHGVHWVEEPLPYSDVAGLARLRRDARTRIAGGEMLPTFEDALTLLDHDALDIYQMDTVLSLGMSGARTFAELARRRNRQFTPHTWTNGIGLLANLHVAAGVGASPYLEFPYDPEGWTLRRRDFMLSEPVRVDTEGYVRVPDVPGLGVVLDEEAIDRWRI
ncbi:MAG: mandelate racemase/muconate lactonizing enzyme family protein [Nocardioidaceae bacterium]